MCTSGDAPLVVVIADRVVGAPVVLRDLLPHFRVVAELPLRDLVRPQQIRDPRPIRPRFRKHDTLPFDVHRICRRRFLQEEVVICGVHRQVASESARTR